MIEICDPNILACPDAEDLLGQLAESKAMVNINQGLDARLLTVSKIELIRRIKMKYYHFAWDNPADESKIVPKLKMFAEMMNANYHNTIVYPSRQSRGIDSPVAIRRGDGAQMKWCRDCMWLEGQHLSML